MSRFAALSACLAFTFCLSLTGCDAGPEDDTEHCGEERPMIVCPVTLIDVQEGEEVEVGTTLHLDARIAKGGTDAELAEWSWSVLGPGESDKDFVPSPLHPNPTFTPLMPGSYLFILHSADADGMESCSPAQRLVEVRTRPLPEFGSDALLGEVGLERQEPSLEALAPTLDDSRLVTADTPSAE